MRIALIATCLADALFPDVARATVTVLQQLGHEVVFPAAQTCCGQMHVNTGYLKEAAPVVRHHVDVFEAANCDYAVAPSGSCVGSVRHQHAMVARWAGDPALAERAIALATRTYELSEFLVDVLGVTDVGAYYPHRVTYHPTCHSLRMLRVGDKPLSLLRNVDGIDLVELPHADVCCGTVARNPRWCGCSGCARFVGVGARVKPEAGQHDGEHHRAGEAGLHVQQIACGDEVETVRDDQEQPHEHGRAGHLQRRSPIHAPEPHPNGHGQRQVDGQDQNRQLGELLEHVGIAQPTCRAEEQHAQRESTHTHDRTHLGEVESEAADRSKPTGWLPVCSGGTHL
jgi:L-lactate dehydrogenase complex protein LldE